MAAGVSDRPEGGSMGNGLNIRSAAISGGLIGAAFNVPGFVQSPSAVEFGVMSGSATVGALLSAIVYRLLIGKV